MKTLRFLHLSDLHLDTNLNLISHKEQCSFQNSPYLALRNFIKLCQDSSPDFVVLSGNIYNKEEASLKARLTLKSAFEELEKLNISVYYACGNLDPLTDKSKEEFSSIKFPANVYIFGTDWEYFSFPPTNHTQNQVETELARIHGISHGSKNDNKNLLASFSPNLESKINIGVLHTSLTTPAIKSRGQDHYAPCSKKDLQEKNMNYWALGHIHDYKVVNENPLIVFSGSAQGLNVNELGPHGCVMVEMSLDDAGHILKTDYTFCNLAAVEWHIVTVKLPSRQEVDSVAKVQKIIAKAITDYVQKLSISPYCEALALRIELSGSSDVSASLQEIEVKHELCNSLEKMNAEPKIFVKDVVSAVRPVFSFESAAERDDILGEVFRVTQDLKQNEKALVQMEKEAAELLKIKISRHTSNAKEKSKLSPKSLERNLSQLLERAEEISVEVFEPNQQ